MMDYAASLWPKFKRKWSLRLAASSKLLLLVAMIELLAVWSIAIIILAFSQYNEASCVNENHEVVDCSSVYVENQSVSFIVWSIFFLISIMTGLFDDSVYELFAAMFLALFLTAWAIFRFAEPYENHYLDWTFLIVTCSCQVAYFVLSYWIYGEYSWRLYRKTGADQAHKQRIQLYQLWNTFLKLDVMFSLFSVLYSGKGIYNEGWMAILDCVAVGSIFIWMLWGYVGVKTENHCVTMTWFFTFSFMPSYIGVMMYFTESITNSQVIVLFYIISAFCLLTHLVMFILSIIIYRNFGFGWEKRPKKRLGSVNVEPSESDALAANNEETGDEYDGIGEDTLNIFDVIRNTHALEKSGNLNSVN
eukprot:TRINITY_DN6343_c0_g1_i1.p1 TRINITY_DN6343_c0_g1~~TRINITY_DN6343_c0_g1_i1.p1  ORF type:complete len:361 (+),score=33.58 TRINITY_DN6343_c0_g1_i1:14-1096(+)